MSPSPSSPIGIGLVTTPWVLTGVRAFADWRRLLAAEWGGVRIQRAYRPLPANANPWARTFGMLGDPATWRDFLWLPVDMTAGTVTALLAFVLPLYPLEGFAIAAGLWRVLPDGYWYGFVRVTDQTSAFYAAASAPCSSSSRSGSPSHAARPLPAHRRGPRLRPGPTRRAGARTDRDPP